MTKQNLGVIYGLYTVKDKSIRYIGKTTKPVDARVREHVLSAKRGKHTPAAAWIRARLEAGVPIKVRVLKQAPVEDLNALEVQYIKALRKEIGNCLGSYVPGACLNVADGGDGVVLTGEANPSTKLADGDINNLLNNFDLNVPRDAEYLRWAHKLKVSKVLIKKLMLGQSPRTKGDPRTIGGWVSKISEEQLNLLMDTFDSSVRPRRIEYKRWADRFSVSLGRIRDLVTGNADRTRNDPRAIVPDREGAASRTAKLTSELVVTIRQLFADGNSAPEVQNWLLTNHLVSVTTAALINVKLGRTWKSVSGPIKGINY